MAFTAWSKRQKENWRELIELLEDEHPAPKRKPVRVLRRHPARDWDSGIHEHADHYLVLLDPAIPYRFAADSLIHEWAHLMAGWDGKGCDQKDHPDEWGVAYATLTRLYYQWLED